MSRYLRCLSPVVVACLAVLPVACGSPTEGRQEELGTSGSSGGGSSSANGIAAATTQTTTGGIISVITNDCGNGTLQANEACDDANTLSGDGCNTACQLELDYDCPTPGAPCISTVVCGNGSLSSVEACDDGNTVAGDGCSVDCMMVEPGWQCRAPGKQCVPLCGDQVLTGGENCDDANTVSGDGCSSTCLTEPGWSCQGVTCTQAVCGNAALETGESCDNGTALNGLFYGDGSGCSKTCTKEPVCRDAAGATVACTTACGDGNIDAAAGETCDDGNAVSGDGCSNACVDETGFTCTTMERKDTQTCATGAGECLVLPITFRDFDGEQVGATGHPDFFYLGTGGRTCVPNASGAEDPALITGANCWTSDSTALCQGLVAANLGADGKPQLGAKTSCKCRFTDWGATGLVTAGATCNSGGAEQPRRTEQNTPVIASAASFAQWYNNDASVNTTVLSTLELAAIGANQFQFSSSNGLTVYDDIAAVTAGTGTTLVSGFFPLEDQPRTKLCNIWPYWKYPAGSNCLADAGQPVTSQWDPSANNGGGNFIAPVIGMDRNFYFTTEVRYLFRFVGGETLSFFGDDDVWVFINGVLALDLGAPHERLQGSVALPAGAGGAAWTATKVNPTTGMQQQVGTGTSTALGLEVGKIYEIAIFHADRHPRESNYQLTISGFSTNQSACVPTCGDGVATTGEECDDGPNNSDTVYGGCTTQCKFGPFCGDGVVADGVEQCDLGRENNAQYGEMGCTSACTLPHFCGDGLIDGAFDEQCDDGANNGSGACLTNCTLQVK